MILANDPVDDVIASLAEAWRPPPRLTVSQWAGGWVDSKGVRHEGHRILSSRESRYPGPWSNDVVPPIVEVMDCLSEHHPARRVVLMSSAQIGKNECAHNFLGYVIHLTPAPILIVSSTVETAKRLSRQRIASMIQACPELERRVAPARSRDGGNSLLQKEFAGGLLVLAGSNSAAGLRSMPARFLVLDESESYEADVDGEGDPCALAEARTRFYKGEEKVFYPSTPTIPGGKIHREFLSGDQRHCWVPCPDCGEYQVLVWEQVRWDADESDQAVRLASARYICAHCQAPWTDAMRARAIRKYEWRALKPFAGTASFSLWTAYNTRASLSEIVGDYEKALEGRLAVEAEQAGDSAGVAEPPDEDDALGDVDESLRVFFNTVLGRPYEGTKSAVDPTGLMSRRESYDFEPVPWRVLVITAGVDVHPDRLEVEVVGWGLGKESWSLGYHVLYGDAGQKAVWAELDRYLTQGYTHPAGHTLAIEASCVDTGGENTQDVYEYCRDPKRWRRRTWAIKGGGGNRPIMGRPKKLTDERGRSTGVTLFTVGVDKIKTRVARQLAVKVQDVAPGEQLPDQPFPDYCHFPLDYDLAYFKQLTAEKSRTVYRSGVPHKVWEKPKGVRNEALDCRVYAVAALTGLNPNLEQRHAMTERLMEEMRERVEAARRGMHLAASAAPVKKKGRRVLGRRE